MKNEHMYKKLKYELTLSYLYNISKYHRPYKQTIWNICKYFNVDFNMQRCNTITNFGYIFYMRLRRDTQYLFLNDVMFMDYANAHNLRLYNAETHKPVNSVQYTTFRYKP